MKLSFACWIRMQLPRHLKIQNGTNGKQEKCWKKTNHFSTFLVTWIQYLLDLRIRIRKNRIILLDPEPPPGPWNLEKDADQTSDYFKMILQNHM
jgi:hypothetical protein